MSIDTDVDDLDEKLAVDMFTDEKLAQDLMEDLCIDGNEEDYHKISVGDPQTILSPSKTHPPDSIAPSSSGPVTTPTTPPTPSLNKTDSPSKTEVLTKVTYRKAKRHSRTFIRNHDTKSSSSSPPSPLSKLGGEEDEYSDDLDDVNDLDSDEYEDETSSTRTVFRRRSLLRGLGVGAYLFAYLSIPNNFDIDTVQRQLRYTGMLETVRIRQAGYNVRLSYDEFIQLYRILLPQGLQSSPSDVREFLLTLNLNRDNYQIGTSKIFLRESEKLRLDFRLHQQIMGSIVAIQKDGHTER
ncbi:myosin-IIIb-like [Diaphorina citri]|uniref:Myosin-IIIb-like n=1 Tax=Diaphorina citri TaxID=121845 RepID=A0A3Q0JDT7_DIACI|nr:myosin-IIIb-like [Diaphorina citri]